MRELAGLEEAVVHGDAVVVTRDGRTLRVEIQRRRGWEFSLAAELGLRLRASLGAPTLLSAEGEHCATAIDRCWRLTTSDPFRAARLLGEAPWPVDEGPRLGIGAQVLAAAADAVPTGSLAPWTTPLFELTVARRRATMRQRAAVVEPEHVVGAVRRLVQLVTRPERLTDEPARGRRRRAVVPYR